MYLFYGSLFDFLIFSAAKKFVLKREIYKQKYKKMNDVLFFCYSHFLWLWPKLFSNKI